MTQQDAWGGGGVQQYLCVPNAIDVQQALQNGLAMSAKAGGIVVHPDDCHVQAAQMLCQPDSLQGMVLVFLHMQCFNTWASELQTRGVVSETLGLSLAESA